MEEPTIVRGKEGDGLLDEAEGGQSLDDGVQEITALVADQQEKLKRLGRRERIWDGEVCTRM